MALLTADEIRKIASLAAGAGLHSRRSTLLAGLDPAYVGGLEEDNRPDAQLFLDLNTMNRDETIAEVTPLEEWLLNAKALSSAFPSRQKFFADMAEKVALAVRASLPVASGEKQAIPEKILFRNDLLPARFMASAVRTALSVVRLVVPQYANGAPRISASSGQPILGFGTGWLIGPAHVITNWHVVVARAKGEPVPSLDDVRLQCSNTTAEFDYDEQDVPPGFKRKVTLLEHYNKPLDYAVLRFEAPEAKLARAPLPIREKTFIVSADDPFPVNIIQHPRGAAKQLGIRNNLAAELKDDQLTYFTDTDAGSSGSPVCDDTWRVVALHRASRLVDKPLNFQGKETAWINEGTPIWPIVEDLKKERPELWKTIGAIVE